jgi:chromosome segregation ATPase
MARPAACAVIVLAFVTSGAFVAHVPAQQPAPAQTELLAEVRLLRQAIESLAGTNARVQIVFGRLQLQEQRTDGAAGRLDKARDALAKNTSEIADVNEHLKDMENRQNDSRRKPEELEQFRMEGVMARRALERLEIARARLLSDEADAAAALNVEQGRWSDLNRQLDELERLLAKPPQ